MSDRRHLLLAGALLVAMAALLLLMGLSTQPFEVYDEGLYGMYARTALHFESWVHVVNTAGQYPVGAVKFSKPPLSIWATAASMHALGPSLFSLRLPFALATACTALLALAFGRLLLDGPKGTWLGFLWGALLILCQGTTSYGRTATIEALLVVFVMAALYAHARALRTTLGRGQLWAALAGLAIGGAFMTKQLVCALAIVPIGAVELLRMRSEPSRSIARLIACFGLPTIGIGTWFYLLYAEVGNAAFDVLWQHAIVNRVSGFDGTHHQNYMNRMAVLLDEQAAPMSWPLGLVGLVLLMMPEQRPARERRDAALLIVGSGVCAWLAFDVGSRAILPWYAYSLLPAIALGLAWLVVHAWHALLETWPASRQEQLTAGAGIGAMVLCVSSAMRPLVPALLAVVVASMCALLAVSLRVAVRRRTILLAGAACLGALLIAGTLSRREYRATEPQPYAELGRELYRRGARNVSLDSRSQLHAYAKTTFFGVGLTAEREPWSSTKKPKADARVQVESLPVELRPRAGVQLIRGAGVYAVMGDLSEPPFAADAIAQALKRGPITFEAEHLTTGRPDTLAYVAGASGGAVRRTAPWWRERAETFALVRGTTPRLPAGSYTAKFWTSFDCSRFRSENLGQAVVTVRGRKLVRGLRCSLKAERTAPAADVQTVTFELTTPGTVEFSVQITQGAVTLDRITLTYAPLHSSDSI